MTDTNAGKPTRRLAHQSECSNSRTGDAIDSRAIKFAVFTKAGGPLSKAISLDEDGIPVSDGSACTMSQGVARNITVNNLTEFGAFLPKLKSENAISLGTIKDVGPDGTADIVTKSQLENHPDAISRSKEHITFAPGSPGLLLVDFDQKGMPTDVVQKLETVGGVWNALAETCPDLTSAGYAQRASTSASLMRRDTGEVFPSSGGVHIYIAACDAADIPRATKVLHQRLWLAGYGWHWLGKVGQILERSIVDQSVGSPERLVFEGPPVLQPPLVQSAKDRKPVVVEGDVVDTKIAIPDLTPAENSRLLRMLASSKRALKPEADRKQAKEDRRLVKKLVRETGVSEKKALEKIKLRHQGKLAPLHPLVFDDASIGEVTVEDVLTHPETYVGQTLADPLEGVSYGRCKAKVMRRTGGGLFINSFAHGGATYDLIFDYVVIKKTIENTTETEILETVADMVSLAHLRADELNRIVDHVKRNTGINKPVIRARFDEKKTEQRASHRRSRSPLDIVDPRVRILRPESDVELTPVLTDLDDVLSQVEASEPPVRSIDGYLAHIVEYPIQGLHTLRKAGTGGADTKSDEAPPQPRLTIAGEAAATMIIEKHIAYHEPEGDDPGSGRVSRLQDTFVKAYAGWKSSALPRVTGIATLPVVLPNGSIAANNGLDRELRLIFRMQPKLLEAIPQPGTVTAELASDAYRWLSNEWLADVDTNNDGKAILIALALTLIEQQLLSERPAFFVTAGQRGSGKTTALNMISTAVFGRQAAAASWSFNDEERRKALFAYLWEGANMVVYDNIPRGSGITCPTIERALTSSGLSDRVLGVSQIQTVPTTAVLSFTGNNVGPKGDMASRSLVAHLLADRPDPENRNFQHDDPIGWSQEHRIEILRHLFSILLVERVEPDIAQTRFKSWWRLVGYPLEISAGVHFEELFRANDAFDEEAQGATEFICMMLKYLETTESGTREFTAAELVKLVDDGWNKHYTVPSKSGTPDPGNLKSALEEASGRPFSNGQVNAHRVARKLKSIAGRPVEIEGELFHIVIVKNHEGNRYRIERL